MHPFTHHSPNERSILEPAARIFALRGYAGTSMDEIARAAGVNKATIYYRIGNKARVYERVLVGYFCHIAEVLEQRLHAVPIPRDRARILVETLAAIFAEHGDMPPLLLHELASGGEHLSPDVLAGIARVLQTSLTTLSALPMVQQGGVSPLLAHLMIIGSLFFTSLSGSVAMRLAANIPQGTEKDVSLELMKDLLLELFVDRDVPSRKED
ncbi:TetR/AcrR family transcriptional regulator [Desulfoplanes formicivorans]|uniref:HTH tetR-type domain-containing protein n=1 Tax=Desulfoplanes formicivorans TaxID=1592317 RepID=A0A194AGQ0_9BACT|nr:TetR/AcrR family transcriptional regulator [Desulfoplanes formicivorans]GAU08503.1 hypothetical protein DPF_1213 [Desulfoplanes formicivorans]